MILTAAYIAIVRSIHSLLMGHISALYSLAANSTESICTGRYSTVQCLFHARSKIASFAEPPLQAASSLTAHSSVVSLLKTTWEEAALPQIHIGMAALLQNAKAGIRYARNDSQKFHLGTACKLRLQFPFAAAGQRGAG